MSSWCIDHDEYALFDLTYPSMALAGMLVEAERPSRNGSR